MLCMTCRRALLQRLHNAHKPSSSLSLLNHATTSTTTTTTTRSVATVPQTKNAAPITPPPSTTSSTSSSAQPNQSQPFSEPFFPSSTASAASTTPGNARPNVSAPRKLTSSVAGGTPLTGLMYTKASAAKPLLALEDDQYPAWLWTLLDAKNADGAAAGEDGSGGVDLASMTKKMRAKYERKQAKLLAGVEKPVPLHEQSRDLTAPGDDARVSVERREELTKSMRGARRKGIREANFLRSM